MRTRIPKVERAGLLARRIYDFATLVLFTFLSGCCAPHREAVAQPPSIVIYQWPDYPAIGRESDFPGGLVAALWRDGRLIRPSAFGMVGKSYVEGTVPPHSRDEFFAFLATATDRALKTKGIPVHAATQSITVRTNGVAREWSRVLPDTESVWNEVEWRLSDLPMQHPRNLAPAVADGFK
jgi:hypothetical protein